MPAAPKNAGTLAARNSQVPTNNQKKSLKQWLSVYSADISRALPKQIGQERFQRICMTALTGNSALQQCDPASFIGAVLNVAQLGLEPNTPLGEAYLIPYGGKCTLQVGYKGLIKLARNSGEIAKIGAEAIHENDEFSYSLGVDPTLHHKPVFGDRGPVIGYYAFFKTKDGDVSFSVATKQEIEKFAKEKSKSFRSGPWQTDFDAMAKKTLLKRVLKYAPLSTEVSRQMAQDETIKSVDVTAENPETDMTLVMDEAINVEYEVTDDENVDPATGEVKDDSGH